MPNEFQGWPISGQFIKSPMFPSGAWTYHLSDFAVALCDRRTVRFVDHNTGSQIESIVTGIVAEDGSGRCWNIHFQNGAKAFVRT